MIDDRIERNVKKYGEEYRELITKAIEYMDKDLSRVPLEEQFNANRYIASIMERVAK